MATPYLTIPVSSSIVTKQVATDYIFQLFFGIGLKPDFRLSRRRSRDFDLRLNQLKSFSLFKLPLSLAEVPSISIQNHISPFLLNFLQLPRLILVCQLLTIPFFIWLYFSLSLYPLNKSFIFDSSCLVFFLSHRHFLLVWMWKVFSASSNLTQFERIAKLISLAWQDWRSQF